MKQKITPVANKKAPNWIVVAVRGSAAYKQTLRKEASERGLWLEDYLQACIDAGRQALKGAGERE